MPNKSTLRKEEFILVHNWGYIHHVREVIVTILRQIFTLHSERGKEVNADAQLFFLFLFSLGPQTWNDTVFRVGHPI